MKLSSLGSRWEAPVRARSPAYLLLCVCLIACGNDEAKPIRDAGDKPLADAGSDAGGGGGLVTLDRSQFTDVGVSGRLDYATPEYWVCRPDIKPNECARNLDATELRPDGTMVVVKHVPAQDPEVDCFYLAPTVWLMRTSQMTDFSDAGVKLMLDPLLSQAARFSRVCRVFAPLYRQAGLSGAFIAQGADIGMSLQDARDAFAYYLEHDNNGRKFVLLSHSQGTFNATALIKRDIDENPDLRSRMLSAITLGGQPYVPPGQHVGGSFKNVPTCSQPGETGCVIHYASFAKEAPATIGSLLGHVTQGAFEVDQVDTGGQVICTEPAALAGNAGRYAGSYFALELNNPTFGAPGKIPGVETPFVLFRDLFRGKCVQANGQSYLEVAAEPQPGDVRPLPGYRNTTLESVGFGMHLVDYNIPLDDLIEVVKRQAASN
jgi:hypothetical protein